MSTLLAATSLFHFPPIHIDFHNGANHFHMSRCNGKLVLSSDRTLSARNPVGGVLLTDSALQTPVGSKNDSVKIELLSHEVNN